MKPKGKGKPAFDVKEFLTKTNGGSSICDYADEGVIYSQGDPANAVFYIHKGKVKVTVVSRQGKETVVAIMGAGDFSIALPRTSGRLDINRFPVLKILDLNLALNETEITQQRAVAKEEPFGPER